MSEAPVGPAITGAVVPGASAHEHDPTRDREVLLRLLSVTASLAGLGIAALGFVEVSSSDANLRTLADEVIAFDVFLFVCCVYLILWALRTTVPGRARMLSRIIDIIFLFALTTMLLASGYIIYWVF